MSFSPSLSDGVGRTGTFICAHAQLERLKTEGIVDIFQYIKSARIHRAGLVPEVVCVISNSVRTRSLNVVGESELRTLQCALKYMCMPSNLTLMHSNSYVY